MSSPTIAAVTPSSRGRYVKSEIVLLPSQTMEAPPRSTSNSRTNSEACYSEMSLYRTAAASTVPAASNLASRSMGSTLS